jgi:hypothetical protein
MPLDKPSSIEPFNDPIRVRGYGLGGKGKGVRVRTIDDDV